MSSQYAGDSANFPDDYTIPDDSDPPTAAAVNIGLEALGDRTAFLRALLGNAFVPVYAEFLSDGTVTIPANAAPFCLLEGCGGGGAGGRGGGQFDVAGELKVVSGGGGGGAILQSRIATCYPG